MIWNELDGAPPRNEPKKYGRGISRQDWKNGVCVLRRGRKRRGDGAAAADDADDEVVHCNHMIELIKNIPEYSQCKDARLQCRVCRAPGATLYCKSCGQNNCGQYFAVCSPGTHGPSCQFQCRCEDGKECKDTGECPDRRCEPGYTYSQTSLRCEIRKFH